MIAFWKKDSDLQYVVQNLLDACWGNVEIALLKMESDYIQLLGKVQGRDSIAYSQWTITDRSKLELQNSSIDVFIELFSE